MKASDLFIQSLEQEGVRFIFGVPGEENLDLLESISKSRIRLILTRHEQAAGFMAATYGRLTGKVGVCLATLGPGATNLVTAAAHAQLGGMPMLMITGQKPIKRHNQGQFQIIDVVDMMRPLTRFSRQIVHGDTIPVLVREAVRRAEEERPGAVHLELPEDIAQETCTARPLPVSGARRPQADEKSIQKAVDMIRTAKQPLVLIGAGANRNRTCRELRGLIDLTGLYFFNTQMGKGVVDERHPRYLGCAALSDSDYLHAAISQADLILNVGHDVIEKPPFFMRPDDTRQVIHVNHFSAQVDEVYFPQLNVVGDIADSVQRIGAELEQTGSRRNFAAFEQARLKVASHLQEKSGDDRFPLIPQYLVSQVRQVMPDDGILTLDNGIYKIWFARHYPAHASNTLLLDNALATMGAGFPSAIAARLVHPERKIMAVCGDGGFMMNSQELETAVRLQLDLVVVILKDNGYGMIKWKQQAMHFHNFGLDYGNPDFVQYAQAYGANGHRVEASGELATLLSHCLNTPGIHMIEVPVDYSENNRVLTRGPDS